MTTPDVQDHAVDQDDDRPAGPWALGQTGLGAVTVGTAAMSVFGPFGLLVGLLVGGGGVVGLLALRRRRNSEKGNSNGTGSGQRSRSPAGLGGRSSPSGKGGKDKKGRFGLPTGKTKGRDGKKDKGGKKLGGLLPTGRKKDKGNSSTPGGNGGKKNKGSKNNGDGRGKGGPLGKLFGRKGPGGKGPGGKGPGGKGPGGKGRGGKNGGMPEWLKPWKWGKGKGSGGTGKGPGGGKGPEGVGPPPVSTNRPPTGSTRPDETSPGKGTGGPKEPNSANPGGKGDPISMGKIRDAAEQWAEAVKGHPLENARDMEHFLDDLAEAKKVIADAEKAAGTRSQEEFPADAAVGEALAEQSRKSQSEAAFMSNFKGIFRKRHQQDYERFEAPRTQERKMDYRAQQD